MKESSKVLVGLGIGIVAGGITGYFLSFQQKDRNSDVKQKSN